MSSVDESKVERFQNKMGRLVRLLETGVILPIEFCSAFNEIIIHAFSSELSEETFRPCVERMPRGLLKLLSDWGGLMPKDVIRPAYNLRFRLDADKAVHLRRLLGMIGEQLKKCDNSVQAEAEYKLPEHVPGDPKPAYWGVSEPYTAGGSRDTNGSLP